MQNRKLGIAFLMLCVFFANGQNLIKITKIASGLSIPVDIAHCNDDRIFILQKAGKIRILQNGKLLDSTFLDITNKVNSRGNEQGLLGLTFHPDYKNNGLFFVNYIDKSTPAQTIVAKYKVSSIDSNRAVNSETVLLKIAQPFTNHNGGCLKFGKDGYLYIGMGDGGSAGDPNNNAQNPKELLGKMLRIDVNSDSTYTIPSSNPFVNNNNYRPEIWSIGLRNPWRFSFDRLNGNLWIGDVGQGDWEEVDYEAYGSKGGVNYGWRCYEGNHNYNLTNCNAKQNYTFPIHEYFSDQTKDGCSITGGYVYRGFHNPTYYGKYIFADYCSGKIWWLEKSTDTTYISKQIYKFLSNQIASFGEDINGELYFTAIAEGALYRISQDCSLKVLSKHIKAPLCTGEDNASVRLTLNDTTSLNYSWSNGSRNAELNNIGSGIYFVTISNSSCSIIDTIVIKETPQLKACVTPVFQSIVCANDSALLIACDMPTAMQYIWKKDGVIVPDLVTKRVAVRESGLYQLQVKDDNACLSEGSDSIKITVHPLPKTPTISIIKDTLIGPANYSSYRWFKLGNFIASSTSNKFIVISEGDYCLTVVDSNHCESEKSNSIKFIVVQNKNYTYQQVDFYPNPVQDMLIVDLTKLDGAAKRFLVFDVEGNGIIDQSILSKIIRINVKTLAKGVFIFRIFDGNGEAIYSDKFLKI
jgi:glucose/arabinose dehydrogenase